MTTWEDFKFICFSQGIDTDIIESCKDFVNEHNLEQRLKHVRSSLGYAELSDIDSVAKGLEEIKDNIFWASEEYDKLGRSRSKQKLKKLKKDPGKYIKRLVLKTYWLSR